MASFGTKKGASLLELEKEKLREEPCFMCSASTLMLIENSLLKLDVNLLVSQAREMLSQIWETPKEITRGEECCLKGLGRTTTVTISKKENQRNSVDLTRLLPVYQRIKCSPTSGSLTASRGQNKAPLLMRW